MLTPQQEQMLAYQAMLEEQSQISPELMGALTALGTGSVGVIAGRAGNAAENLGRKVIGKKPMGGLRRLSDRQLLSGALAQAYSNQGQMLNSGII